ncbi:MAG: AAA family ATPase, partial [Bacteroidota bacterium]
TYPLPEAQLDRFMFNLWLEYPRFDEEVTIVKTTTSPYQAKLKQILNAKEIIAFQDLVRRVPVAENVIRFAVELVERTRPHSPTALPFVKNWIRWGAGPRASQYLILGAKTRAILSDRHTPDVDDVKTMAAPVLRHRLVTSFNAEAEGVSTLQIIEKLLENSD